MLKRLMAKVFPQTTASAVSDLERTLEKLSQAEACHSEAARQARHMFGLERDQQAEDPVVRQTTTFRILKDRYTGQATGEVLYLAYDRDTGLLSLTEAPEPSSPFKDESEF